GGGGRQATPLAFARRVSRLARRDESDPRPEFDRDGHSHRAPAGGMAGAAGRGELLYSPGGAHCYSFGLGLRSLRFTPAGRRPPVRREAGRYRNHFASIVGTRARRRHNKNTLGFSGG